MKNADHVEYYGDISRLEGERFSCWRAHHRGEIPIHNSPYRYQEKIKIFRKAKFVVVVENLFADGYVTEKLAEPLAALTVPVYFGNPR
ncbi:MAG: glycosyltransferase family 10, partial [Chitinophagaceae bacterium]|nr:glycosyltransferase family 10 [Chitinophagaceae bacterium]